MTPSEREEIEKAADRVLDKIMDMVDNDGRLSLDTLPIIAAEISTQVAKARACAIEECAKIAIESESQYCLSEDEKNTAIRIAEAIRRRLYE